MIQRRALGFVPLLRPHVSAHHLCLRRGFAKRMNSVGKGFPAQEEELSQLTPREQALFDAQQRSEKKKARKQGKGAKKPTAEADSGRSSKALLTKWMNFLRPEPMVEYRTEDQLALDQTWAKRLRLFCARNELPSHSHLFYLLCRYTELKLIEHKENFKTENLFWDTKQAAIAALPPRLKKSAMIEVGFPFLCPSFFAVVPQQTLFSHQRI